MGFWWPSFSNREWQVCHMLYLMLILKFYWQENQLHFYYLMFRKTQIGVVHRGTGTDPICGNPDAPALYMRVTSFKKWIQKHTNNTALDSNCRTDS